MDESRELKFVDKSITLEPIIVTGALFNTLNLIPQGQTESQRVGRTVLVKRIGLRYTLTLPKVTSSATLPDGDIVRRILFLDRQANGATAQILDILDSLDIHSFYSEANKDRFWIIADTIRDIVAVSTAITPGGNFNSPSVHLENVHYYDLNDVIEFDGADGTIDEITSNNLGLMFISHDGIVGVNGIIRVWYLD